MSADKVQKKQEHVIVPDSVLFETNENGAISPALAALMADMTSAQWCSSSVTPRQSSYTSVFCSHPHEYEGEMCANGVTGVQGTNIRKQKACCPLTCLNAYGEPHCGLKRCGSRAGGRHECCIRTINEEGEDCADSGKAPCFIGKRLPQSNRCGSL